MRYSRIKIRRILAFTVLVIVVFDGAWFVYRSQPKNTEFLLEPTQTSFVDDARNSAAFPVFEPATREWLFRGKARSSLKAFVKDSDPKHLGPDSVGKLIVIRFPEKMPASSLRAAFLSLSDQGICKVAVLGFGQPDLGSRFPEGAVYVLKSVQDDHGKAELCNEATDR